MSNPPVAIRVRSTMAVVRADIGPTVNDHYNFILDAAGSPFRWAAGSTVADDGWTAIVPIGGGSAGAWLRVREDDAGALITAATTTLTVGGRRWRRIAAGALSANLSLSLSVTAAEAGDVIEVTRFDVGAYTVALVNGGPAAGTLVTLPVSARSRALVYFDGTNWLLRDSHLML